MSLPSSTSILRLSQVPIGLRWTRSELSGGERSKTEFRERIPKAEERTILDSEYNKTTKMEKMGKMITKTFLNLTMLIRREVFGIIIQRMLNSFYHSIQIIFMPLVIINLEIDIVPFILFHFISR